MTILAGIIAPHPPILIPEIGGRRLSLVAATMQALNEAARTIARVKADALIFISPHSPVLDGCFAIRGHDPLEGTFRQFGWETLGKTVANDLETVAAFTKAFKRHSLPAAVVQPGVVDPNLDWGVLVPYWYLGGSLPIVALSISNLSLDHHYRLGQAVAHAASETGKNYVFVASGDLSHRLTPDAPYGFSGSGPEFDRLVCEIIESGRLNQLMGLDAGLSMAAGECGLRSFVALAGALSKVKVEPKVLSYEGPFGVGYLVAQLLVEGGLESD